MPIDAVLAGVGLVVAGFVAGAYLTAKRCGVLTSGLLNSQRQHYQTVNMAVANCAYQLVKDRMTGPEFCQQIMAISRRDLGIELHLVHSQE